MIKRICILAMSLLICLSGLAQKNMAVASHKTPAGFIAATPVAIPLAGNGFITHQNDKSTEEINDGGLTKWQDAKTIVSTYFRLGQTGLLNVAIKASVQQGKRSSIKVTVNGIAFTIQLSGKDATIYFAGTINITDTGYVKVELQGISKTGVFFAEVSDIMIGGTAALAKVIFAGDSANYYWSRRGPSCHLNYSTPAADKAFFYSELTVPIGEDKVGSYFMANGFGEGYMGIQVNSPTERRVLFSVWDPSQGQTTLLRNGANVTAGRFGGEGTGGQSYLVFNWKAGNTYKFLTEGKPGSNGNTVYTSWFYAPENGAWKLIASFSRPDTAKYLGSFHSFLENFEPTQGYLERSAHWGNQWVYLASGSWSEVTTCRYSVDATGKNKQRMDFAGGVENGQFFLRNGGFFATSTVPGTTFTRPATGVAPEINFAALP